MKQIKFRAWLPEEGKMIYSEGLHSEDTHFWLNHDGHLYLQLLKHEISSDGYRHACWTTPEQKIMQFTGIKNRDGKDIYEGDIVRFGWVEHKVEWCDQRGGYFIEYHRNNPDGSEAQITNCLGNIADALELIGNIYEHESETS